MIRARRHRYRSWDGLGATGLSAEQVLEALGERLLDGDIDRELDRAMYQGIPDPADGEGVTGLDQLRNQIRSERRDLEQQAQERATAETLARFTEALLEYAGDGVSEGLSGALRSLAADPSQINQMLRNLQADQRRELQAEIEAPREDADAAQAAPLDKTLETLTHLLNLAELESHLRTIRTVADVQNIELGLIAHALGDAAAFETERLQLSLLEFQASGYVRRRGLRTALSARVL